MQFFTAWLATTQPVSRRAAPARRSARRARSTPRRRARRGSCRTARAPRARSTARGVRAARMSSCARATPAPSTAAPEFQRNALQAPDIAQQFVTAWEFGSTSAVQALATSGAASQTQALNAHRTDGWQAPSWWDGTAGSFYCTYTAGLHAADPAGRRRHGAHQVIGVTITRRVKEDAHAEALSQPPEPDPMADPATFADLAMPHMSGLYVAAMRMTHNAARRRGPGPETLPARAYTVVRGGSARAPT